MKHLFLISYPFLICGINAVCLKNYCAGCVPYNWKDNLDFCKWVCVLKGLKWQLRETCFPPWKTANYSWHALVPLQPLLTAAGQAKSQTLTCRMTYLSQWNWLTSHGWGSKFPFNCQSSRFNCVFLKNISLYIYYLVITITKFLGLKSSWQHCSIEWLNLVIAGVLPE